MKTVGEKVEQVAKEFLGPAASIFLTRELTSIGVTLESMRGPHVPALVARAERAAARLMDADRARDFVVALTACAVGSAAQAADTGAVARDATSRDGIGIAATTVAERVGQVAKEFLGPAAAIFLRRELTAIGVTLESMREAHVPVLAARAERAAARLMEADRAHEFITALRACADGSVAPDADTYRALARDAISRDDIHTAVAALRDGAATLSHAKDRAGALALLEQAVRVAPGDLTAHRRLAAALVNRDDVGAACAEYARFVDLAVTRGDTRRAWLELTYAREMLGELPDLLVIADRLLPAAVASAASAAATATLAAAPPDEGHGPLAGRDRPSERAVAGRDRLAERAVAGPSGDRPSARASAPSIDVISYARTLLAEGKVGAAADLLLDHIARGSTDRDAQRLLIEIGCKIGRPDIARDKCHALVTAYRLDGDADAASDIERLAASL